MSSNGARSPTVLAIGPSVPFTLGQPPYTPLRLTRPAVGRIPARQFHPDGLRMDASPSCPIATALKFAETAAPGPPDDPPTVRSGSYGFRVEPNSEPWVSPPPSSPSVALARTIAPALRSCPTTNASRGGR